MSRTIRPAILFLALSALPLLAAPVSGKSPFMHPEDFPGRSQPATPISSDLSQALRLLAMDRPQDAFPLVVKAAQTDDAASAYVLAGLYAQGKGTAKDPGKAKQWLEKASSAGYPRAMYSLGMRLAVASRKGSPENLHGCGLLQKAADAGCGPAMAFLGIDRLSGSYCGVKDSAQAEQLIRDSGNATDLSSILFDRGDPLQGLALLQQAASEGDTKAMFMLYSRYSKGDGLKKDLMKAYAALVLYQKASGRDVVGNLEALAREMTPDEIMEALGYSAGTAR